MGLQGRDELGDVLALPLRLQGALLLGLLARDRAHLGSAFLGTSANSAPWKIEMQSSHVSLEVTCWSTELDRDLLAPCLRCELLHRGLLHVAHLPWPLAALGVGGVARGLVLALLLDDGLAGHHVVFNVVLLLQSLALRLVFRAAKTIVKIFATVLRPEVLIILAVLASKCFRFVSCDYQLKIVS